MELKNLIDNHLDLERLSKDLDELGHTGRVWAIKTWGKDTQAKLYEAAKGFRKLTLDDFVPPATSPLTQVIHHGRNSLKMHNFFEKRFCRPANPESKDVLWGYNHQSLSMFSGPGYFVTHPASEEGEIDIDYTMLPKEKPEAWPPIVAHRMPFGKLAFDGMVDVMRGVSSHVTIGRARKLRGYIDTWFVLVREDPAAAA
jgi:hypothetical protein